MQVWDHVPSQPGQIRLPAEGVGWQQQGVRIISTSVVGVRGGMSEQNGMQGIEVASMGAFQVKQGECLGTTGNMVMAVGSR